MRITQGAFSFLPDLTDDEITKQLEYCLKNDWAVSIEHTDDAHPRNTYWDMWGAPMFDLHDPAGIMLELAECRLANPDDYVRVTAFNSTHGVESVALSFIVQRPAKEPGFRLDRTDTAGRSQRYSMVSYAVDRSAPGERYGAQA